MVAFPCLAAQFHRVLLWFIFADTLVQDKLLPIPRPMQVV